MTAFADISVDSLDYSTLAAVFDHAILKPEHTKADTIEGCTLAKKYLFKSVCVKPCHVSTAAEELKGTSVLVGTVISFPHGNSTTAVKVAESLQAIEDGAIELDVVINIDLLKTDKDACQKELVSVINKSKEKNKDVVFKIIFETALLTQSEIEEACEIALNAGAEFVKTSTGFASSGATLDNVKLMHRLVAPHKREVKASGGIKTLDQVVGFMQAGATRCGSSSTAQILDDFRKRKGLPNIS